MLNSLILSPEDELQEWHESMVKVLWQLNAAVAFMRNLLIKMKVIFIKMFVSLLGVTCVLILPSVTQLRAIILEIL